MKFLEPVDIDATNENYKINTPFDMEHFVTVYIPVPAVHISINFISGALIKFVIKYFLFNYYN